MYVAAICIVPMGHAFARLARAIATATTRMVVKRHRYSVVKLDNVPTRAKFVATCVAMRRVVMARFASISRRIRCIVAIVRRRVRRRSVARAAFASTI